MINPELELELEITEVSAEKRAFRVCWTVPERLSYLEGHFPGFPVLPGVAMIDITLEALRRALQLPSIRLSKLQNAKFSQPVHPGQKIEIQLISLSIEGAWKAEWKSASISVAELTLGHSHGLSRSG